MPTILDDRVSASFLVMGATLLMAVGGAIVAGSCQAPLEQKRGYVGDFCNGSDEECRKGLVCEDGVCKSVNNAKDVCDVVCRKYAQCNVGVESCQPACLKTLSEWTKKKTSQYRDCHSTSQCSRFKNRNRPWNYCFNQLPPAPQSRVSACNKISSQSKKCLNARNIDPKGRIKNLKRACKTEARTVSDERWKKNKRCKEQKNDSGDILCVKLFRCANTQFELTGADRLPTSPPDNSGN